MVFAVIFVLKYHFSMLCIFYQTKLSTEFAVFLSRLQNNNFKITLITEICFTFAVKTNKSHT